MSGGRPISITVLAWLWIAAGGFGATFNIYALLTNLSPYPQWIWAALLPSRMGTIVAGVFLLRMKKVAAWIYAVVAIYGWALALGFTNAYTPVPGWRYLVGLAVLAVYAFIIWRSWNKLQPQRDAVGVTSHA